MPHLDGVEFTDPYRKTAEALGSWKGVSGVRLTAERAAGRHPASVIGDLSAMDRIAQLNAAVTRRNTVPVEERMAEARAQ